MILFPIIAYGNSRYLIYYDTFLFVIIGLFLFEIIEKLGFFINNRSNA
jgi:hypothetical protein